MLVYSSVLMSLGSAVSAADAPSVLDITSDICTLEPSEVLDGSAFDTHNPLPDFLCLYSGCICRWHGSDSAVDPDSWTFDNSWADDPSVFQGTL